MSVREGQPPLLGYMTPIGSSISSSPIPRRLTLWLFVIAAGLCAASLACQFVIHVLERDKLEPWLIKFDVDAEANLPTWFSSVLLLACATGFAVCARCDQSEQRRGYWLLAAGFAAMSLDETAQLHEELGFLQSMLHTHGLLYFAWVIPATIVVVAIITMLLPFLSRLPRRFRNDMLIAGAMYLAGALGFEALGGWHAEVEGFNNFTHSLIATAEEALEMAGIILLLAAQIRAIYRPADVVARATLMPVELL